MVIGKIKREIGLVVPVKFTTATVSKKLAEILKEKLIKTENLPDESEKKRKVFNEPLLPD